MDLIDRYLAAIARELPEAERGDIIAELRDILLSQMEEREAELGRPLDGPEIEALLKTFGHPTVVAGRYRSGQHLIGPEIYPFYLRALKTFFYVFLALGLGLLVLRISTGDAGAWVIIPGVIDAVVWSAIWAAAAATVVFALIERAGGASKLLHWRPRDLPPVGAGRRKDLFEIAFDTVIDVVFIAWWTGTVTFADWIPGPDRPLDVSLTPVWSSFYWPVLLTAFASMGFNALLLLRPGWERVNAWVGLGVNGYTALLGLVLIPLGPWVAVSGNASGEAIAWRAEVLNNAMLGLLVFLVAVHALEAYKDVHRLLRGGRRSSARPAMG